MTVFEYHKKAFLEMKDKPPKERREYFWEYYKWYAIALILVIAAIIYTVVTFANRKDDVLYGTLMNSTTLGGEEVTYWDDFYAIADIDPEEEQVYISTDVTFTDQLMTQDGYIFDASQILIASVAAKQVDFIAGPDTIFEKCSYNSSRLLADLRDIVDAETLEQWKDRLYYIDGEVFEQVRNATTVMPELPDPRDPEAMADPVPVAIDISDCTEFAESYYTSGQTLYLGVTINAPHLDTTLQFIDYLLTK